MKPCLSLNKPMWAHVACALWHPLVAFGDQCSFVLVVMEVHDPTAQLTWFRHIQTDRIYHEGAEGRGSRLVGRSSQQQRRAFSRVGMLVRS